VTQEYRTQRESGRGDRPFWAAPDIAKAGYPVFPLAPKGKIPSVTGGFYAATTDPSQLAAWIEEGREHHDVGIATGIVSDVVIVEADTSEAYTQMEAEYGSPHVKTRRGGHWYFRHPKDGKVISTSIRNGLDRKADGGYVSVPPSTGKSWTNGIPDKDTLAVLPPELRGAEEQRDKRGAGPGRAEDLGGEEIPNGSRNKALTSIGGSLRRRGLDEAAIRGALLGINAEKCRPPLPEAEVEKIARSVARYAPSGIGGGGAIRSDSIRTANHKNASFHLTDLGNAERLVAQHGRDLRYVHLWRRWLVWDGTRWAVDDAGEVERRAIETVRSIYAEAERAEDGEERKRIARHATASESRTRIEGMIALARSLPGVPVEPERLDADLWLLNCLNGRVDLRTGELREHRREDLITKLAPVEYDPDATAPTFERFLERILPSEALRRFVRRAVGYAATGVISEEMLVILHGTGANGKSTLVNAVMDTLGDYAMQVAPDLLLAKRASHPTELADLFGARLAAAVEVDQDRRLAESLVKQLTGRDRIKARRMREDFWEFDPTHTIFLATNHRPEVRGTDHAIWRRLKLVPFDVTIPEAEQDKRLAAKLRAERPGIIASIVRGCLEYQRGGLGEPEEVKVATEGYRVEMDVLAAFIEDRCVVHPRASAGATPLYNAYKDWCDESGETKLTQTKFGRRLKERGFRSEKSQRVTWYGIGLRDDRPDPDGGPVDSSGDNPGGPNLPEGPVPSSYRLDVDSSAPNRLNERSRIDKGDYQGGPLDIRQSRPKNDINDSNSAHEAVISIKGLKPSNRLKLSAQSEREDDPTRRGDRDPAIGQILADPPEWLVELLDRCRQDQDLLRPTGSAISYEVYGTSARWAEVRPILEEYLGGGSPAA
jgi:putative DNA primase/helicase